jgi:hypothetical protein
MHRKDSTTKESPFREQVHINQGEARRGGAWLKSQHLGQAGLGL